MIAEENEWERRGSLFDLIRWLSRLTATLLRSGGANSNARILGRGAFELGASLLRTMPVSEHLGDIGQMQAARA
jgi:hypothetical protein